MPCRSRPCCEWPGRRSERITAKDGGVGETARGGSVGGRCSGAAEQTTAQAPATTMTMICQDRSSCSPDQGQIPRMGKARRRDATEWVPKTDGGGIADDGSKEAISSWVTDGCGHGEQCMGRQAGRQGGGRVARARRGRCLWAAKPAVCGVCGWVCSARGGCLRCVVGRPVIQSAVQTGVMGWWWWWRGRMCAIKEGRRRPDSAVVDRGCYPRLMTIIICSDTRASKWQGSFRPTAHCPVDPRLLAASVPIRPSRTYVSLLSCHVLFYLNINLQVRPVRPGGTRGALFQLASMPAPD